MNPQSTHWKHNTQARIRLLCKEKKRLLAYGRLLMYLIEDKSICPHYFDENTRKCAFCDMSYIDYCYYQARLGKTL